MLKEKGKVSILGKDYTPIITNEHNLIHGGEIFTAQLSNGALGASATFLMEMILPVLLEAHIKSIMFYCADDGHFELIEAPTITDGSTDIPVRNRKRNSIKASNITSLFSNPTGISAGTILDDLYFTNSVLADDPPVVLDWEWILKANTKYLFRLTNDGSSAATAFLKVNWYEREE